jgi:hypothetical protein
MSITWMMRKLVEVLRMETFHNFKKKLPPSIFMYQFYQSLWNNSRFFSGSRVKSFCPIYKYGKRLLHLLIYLSIYLSSFYLFDYLFINYQFVHRSIFPDICPPLHLHLPFIYLHIYISTNPHIHTSTFLPNLPNLPINLSIYITA